jgi:hypothetical protein
MFQREYARLHGFISHEITFMNLHCGDNLKPNLLIPTEYVHNNSVFPLLCARVCSHGNGCLMVLLLLLLLLLCAKWSESWVVCAAKAFIFKLRRALPVDLSSRQVGMHVELPSNGSAQTEEPPSFSPWCFINFCWLLSETSQSSRFWVRRFTSTFRRRSRTRAWLFAPESNSSSKVQWYMYVPPALPLEALRLA